LVIVHINGYPGVGKLTIGRALADLIGGKLLDNHTVFNVAFALTEFKSPAFYDTVRSVREIAYRRILELPPTVPVVLTNWYSQESAWGEENWERAIALARERDCALNVVILSCLPDENARRIQSPERAGKRKPQDAEMVEDNRNGRPLLERGGNRLLRLDVTRLSATDAAREIADWLRR
jgi:predicted kinase